MSATVLDDFSDIFFGDVRNYRIESSKDGIILNAGFKLNAQERSDAIVILKTD